jgi:hypothetical protein
MKTYQIARLRPDKIARYEQIHAEQDVDHKASMWRAGYRYLEIWRCGEHLVLAAERVPMSERNPIPGDEEVARAWHAALRDCFAEDWQPLTAIYRFGNTQ